jgi:hypothetical protein
VITRVGKVIVPVADQQAALDFWTTGMGFELVRDDTYGNERWIEVRPPNQQLLLVLSPRQPDEPRRTVPERQPHSDLFFDCEDIEASGEMAAQVWLMNRPQAARRLRHPARRFASWTSWSAAGTSRERRFQALRDR